MDWLNHQIKFKRMRQLPICELMNNNFNRLEAV